MAWGTPTNIGDALAIGPARVGTPSLQSEVFIYHLLRIFCE